ncbi:hypothetical protein IT396_00355 [Candidatus Nomurabacteria bacterium]|nr:hypothetical protein [Candidatus Nomurabacteria bacterium]
MFVRLWCLVLVGFAFAAGPAEAQWFFKKPSAPKKIQKAPKPQKVKEEQLKKQRDMLWDVGDKAMNRALGYLPGPTGLIGSYGYATVLSVVANVGYSAFHVGDTEDRELGHGEVWGTILATLNPLPFPVPALYQAGVSAWKDKDLCSSSEHRDYPGLSQPEQPERDLIPKAARASWYGQRWCGHERDTQYDALLKDAGMTKKIFANTPKAAPRRERGKVIIGPIIISMVAVPTPGVSWEPPPPSPLLTQCAWPTFDGDGNKVVERGCS